MDLGNSYWLAINYCFQIYFYFTFSLSHDYRTIEHSTLQVANYWVTLFLFSPYKNLSLILDEIKIDYFNSTVHGSIIL
jgi:hypothetical protein